MGKYLLLAFLVVLLSGCGSGTTESGGSDAPLTEAQLAPLLESAKNRGTLVEYAPYNALTANRYSWVACWVSDVYVYTARTVVYVRGCGYEYFRDKNRFTRATLAGIAAQAFIGKKRLWFYTDDTSNSWSNFAL